MLAGGQPPSIKKKVMADMAGVVMAESPVLVAGRPVTLLLILGRRLGPSVARVSPLLVILRKCRWKGRINGSLRTHCRTMGVPMLVCATWHTLGWIWALVVCKACLQSVC